MNSWLVKADEEEPECSQSPDLNLTKHFWDDLEQWQHPRPSHPSSVPDLTNALGVSE